MPSLKTIKGKKKEYQKPHSTFNYQSPEWRKLRNTHIMYQPLCQECLKNDIVKAGEEVDHIIPIKQGGKPLSPSNLQTLCKSCHSRKSAKERWNR